MAQQQQQHQQQQQQHQQQQQQQQHPQQQHQHQQHQQHQQLQQASTSAALCELPALGVASATEQRGGRYVISSLGRRWALWTSQLPENTDATTLATSGKWWSCDDN